MLAYPIRVAAAAAAAGAPVKPDAVGLVSLDYPFQTGIGVAQIFWRWQHPQSKGSRLRQGVMLQTSSDRSVIFLGPRAECHESGVRHTTHSAKSHASPKQGASASTSFASWTYLISRAMPLVSSWLVVCAAGPDKKCCSKNDHAQADQPCTERVRVLRKA